MMLDLDAIRRAWCPDTCGTVPFDFKCRARGQCAVTALVVQDIVGGEILRAEVDGAGHYWNLIPGMGEIDLTREQFAPDTVIPRGEIVTRDRLLYGPRAKVARTLERYQKLARLVPWT